jgi:hypothetical protein
MLGKGPLASKQYGWTDKILEVVLGPRIVICGGNEVQATQVDAWPSFEVHTQRYIEDCTQTSHGVPSLEETPISAPGRGRETAADQCRGRRRAERR